MIGYILYLKIALSSHLPLPGMLFQGLDRVVFTPLFYNRICRSCRRNYNNVYRHSRHTCNILFRQGASHIHIFPCPFCPPVILFFLYPSDNLNRQSDNASITQIQIKITIRLVGSTKRSVFSSPTWRIIFKRGDSGKNLTIE